MIDTATICRTPARWPTSWRFRDADVKNSVAASWRGSRGRVDDAVGAGERVVETVAADRVDAG